MASSSSSPEITSASAQPQVRFSYKDASQDEVLDDLSSRFILNLPDEELASLERLCFQVEQAHWFYEDFIREQNTKLPSLPLKKFSEMLFHACPLLHQWSDDHEQAFNQFMQYKTRVPVCGAIMLNDAMDKCVLVKGWKASSGWGFPKGKINEVEPPPICAIREVLEETGYNLAGQLDPQNVIELSIKEQKISLFVVPGIPEDFQFETKTRKEISKIEWFKLSDLPTWKRNKAAPGRFYLISPFISPLKAFINQRKPRNNQKKPIKQRKGPPTAPQAQVASNYTSVPPSQEVVQESGSQSSVDVAGPQTPSPQQHEPAIATNTDVSGMDPHFARLLSSLTLSATSNGHVSHDKLLPSADSQSQSNKVGSSSTPHSETSGESPTVGHAAEQLDWSSSVPPNYSQSSEAQSLPDSTFTTSASSQSLNINGIRSSQPQANSVVARVEDSSTDSSQTVTLALPSAPSATSPTSPTSQTSNRRTSTADISPYLSRAVEVPTSGKKLQQLSLLESIASESEKMAPLIAARAAMVSRGPAPSQFPPQSSSVHPPSMIPDTSRDLGILYSSGHPRPPASASGFHPRAPMENFSLSYHDPFQVRSRTSQAFHRGPMHNPTGSVHLNQQHLLATINGSRAGPVSPNYQMAPQYAQHPPPPPPMFNPGPQYYAAPRNVQYIPSQPNMQYGTATFPSDRLPPLPQTSVRPYPVSHHMPGPGPNMLPMEAHSQSSMALLSILNGRPSQVHQ